jgi:hypothetical protein
MTSQDQIPKWQHDGYPHIWMPYTQMKTAPLPTAVVRTEGVYLELANGCHLFDGMSCLMDGDTRLQEPAPDRRVWIRPF